ncbi:hypothetical protein vseg_003677 [Gypsophila vaccaria]
MASKGVIGDEIFPQMKLTLQDFAAEEDYGFGSPAKGECSAGNDPNIAETVDQWMASMTTNLAAQSAGVADLKKDLVDKLAGTEESVKTLPVIISVVLLTASTSPNLSHILARLDEIQSTQVKMARKIDELATIKAYFLAKLTPIAALPRIFEHSNSSQQMT